MNRIQAAVEAQERAEELFKALHCKNEDLGTKVFVDSDGDIRVEVGVRYIYLNQEQAAFLMNTLREWL